METPTIWGGDSDLCTSEKEGLRGKSRGGGGEWDFHFFSSKANPTLVTQPQPSKHVTLYVLSEN